MEDASSRLSWPNPLRTPLLIAAAVATFVGYVVWVGGTGGIDPSGLEREEPGVSSSITIGSLLETMGGPTQVLLVVSLIAAALRARWRDTVAGLRFALGSRDPRFLAGAAFFWATAARVAAWGGVVLGFAAVGSAEILIHRQYELGHAYSTDILWSIYPLTLYAPLVGILLGRIVFGLLAGGARIRADEPRSEPVFSRVQDVALAALVALPWYLLLLMTWRLDS